LRFLIREVKVGTKIALPAVETPLLPHSPADWPFLGPYNYAVVGHQYCLVFHNHFRIHMIAYLDDWLLFEKTST
jgi:hypothetical protein